MAVGVNILLCVILIHIKWLFKQLGMNLNLFSDHKTLINEKMHMQRIKNICGQYWFIFKAELSSDLVIIQCLFFLLVILANF